MSGKPTYEELEQRIRALEKEVLEHRQFRRLQWEGSERYKMLVDTMYDGFGIQDRNGLFTYVNRALCQILGYEPHELIGRRVMDFLDEENRGILKEQLDRRRKGNLNSYELVWTAKDGKEVFTIISPNLIYDENGELAAAYAVVTDISARIAAERELAYQTNRLRSLIEHSALAIVTLDEKHHIVSCNQFFEEVFQFKKSEITGKNLDEVIAGREYIQDAAAYTHKTLKGSAIYGSGKRYRKDGTLIDVEFHGVPVIVEEKVVGAYGIYQDITERTRTEKTQLLNESRLKALLSLNQMVQSSMQVITDFALESAIELTESKIGYLAFMNKSETVLTMHSWSKEAMAQCSVIDKPIDYPVETTGLWGEAVRQRKPIITNDYSDPNPLKKGCPEGHVEIKRHMNIPVIDGERIVAVAGVGNKDEEYDESDLLQLTLMMQGMWRLIQRKQVKEDTKKLEAQLQQAQKMEAIGTLAGGVAHDFNNLLMGIQGRASLMLMSKDSSHADFEHLKGIQDYVKSAADLTRQLLGFARGGKYEVKPTDLNGLLKKSSEMFGRTKKEITIHPKYQKNLWTVEADPGQIEQVLLNLYVNAWQAMPGGGELYLETQNSVIDEHYSKPYYVGPGKYVKISITDTGSGMDEATRKRIFDPFFTTKEMGRGTGLGLASVYGIIKNHGGFIDVYSEKGHGTTFKIHLPAMETKDVAQRAEAKKGLETARGSETILLVDDEDMIRSGSISHGPDLVILDMIMPDMGGGETYDRLKEIHPDIKVLLSSGYSIDGQATEILKRGCNGFIQKPFHIEALSQKLREILDD
ncbi:MAG: PAS domain S-box protein [Deltaproteobacteria bacterium]|nr:PAS domain S-box protein [Deltaproteobacteria bacterium]